MTFAEQLETFSAYFSPALYTFGISAIILETLIFALQRKPRDKKSRWLGIACGALSFGGGYVFYTLVMYGVQSWIYQYRIFDLGFAWYAWVICFFVNDILFYVSHRFQHEVRLFWCVHVVHHSPKHYDLTTGIRGSAFDALFHFPFFFWVPLLGIHPLIYIILDTGFKFIGLAYHTEFVQKLGLLDKILVTPSNHRVHHGSDVKYLDRNYGGFFIFWDKFFGSYQHEEEKPTYGIRKNWHGYNVIDCQLHEFADLWRDVRNAPSFKDKLRYLYMPPGWRHDGTGKTSEQLRETLQTAH